MPNVPLSDGFGLNLQASLNPDSAFAKYFQSPPALSAVQKDLASLENVPLSSFPLTSTEIGLTFSQPTSVAVGSPQFAGCAGVSGALCVVNSGRLFDPDPFGGPIDLPSGQAYLGVGMKIALAPGVAGAAGNLDYGFAAGSTITLSHYQLFPTAAPPTTFKAALQTALQNYVIPLAVEDLTAMQKGDVAVLEGSGSLKLSGTFNLLTAVNPLVSVSTAALPVTLQVQEGATIAISAGCTITGDLQVRVQKLDGATVRLGVYRKRGAEYTVQVEPSVGLTVGTSSTDFISAIFGAVGPDPFPSADERVKSGLSPSKQETIQSALKAGIQRSLALAVIGEFHGGAADEVAFLYELDLNGLSVDGHAAVQNALRLNLSALTQPAALPQGIKELQSLVTRTRKKGASLKLNILGIYNFTSVNELALKGTVLTDPASGQVLITDSATATRVSGAVNFLADSDKLRKALAQSFLMTAAYRCSGMLAGPPTLNASYWHFDEQVKTSRSNMAAHLHVISALRLITAEQEQQSLAPAADFGHSTFYVNTDFDNGLSESLFLDGSGQPHGVNEYESIGRKALQLVIVPGGDDAYRLRPLQDDGIWQQVKQTGGTAVNLAPIFPDLNRDTQIPIVAGDYLVIAWWSSTMARMAQSLSAAKRFFAQQPPPSRDSPEFKQVQTNLWHQLAAVTTNTHDRFSDPWGLLAMDLASGQRSQASARIVSPRLSLMLERH